MAASARATRASGLADRAAVAAVLWTTVLCAVLIDGGYSATAQLLFIVAAGIALVAAVAASQALTRAAITSPPIASLFALAALSSVSATWSLADSAEALRWGLVVAGYGLVAVAAAAVHRHLGLASLLALLAVVGTVGAFVGLFAVATHLEPWAQVSEGAWRPTGTFEYPPALAFTQVAALPALLHWMMTARRRPAAFAAAGAAAAIAVVVLSDSRLQLALAAAVIAVAALGPSVSSRDRTRASVSAALILLAAVVTGFSSTASTAPGSGSGSIFRFVVLILPTLAAAVAWYGWRGSPCDDWSASPRVLQRAAIVVGAAALSAAILTVAVDSDPCAAGSRETITCLSHDRTKLWAAGLETAGDHPIVGVGAQGFLDGSREEQADSPIRYAHSLPVEALAELGPLGLASVLALFSSVALLLFRTRQTQAGWLLGLPVAAFLITNTLDWSWHLAGAGAVWAAALGGLVASGWTDHSP